MNGVGPIAGREPPWQRGEPKFAHEWVFHHACERADSIALDDGSEEVTYGELACRVERVAAELSSMGVGPEHCVGLFLERSVGMVVGLLGILRAGAAYLPLDPMLPAQRLAFMADDAELGLVVTEARLAPRAAAWSARTLLLSELLRSKLPAVKPTGLSANNLAYVIYTSGSTGRPKGVMIEHAGLSNLCWATREVLDVRPDSRVLQFASIGFDASVFEIFMALAAGASLRIAVGEARVPGPALLRLLSEAAITHATLLPSTLAALPVSPLPALQVLTSAGEALSAELCARWAPGRRLFNAYGPTEATVWVSVHECSATETQPPIGKAVRGFELVVLGPDREPVPAGELGELCVRGVGVARGYLKRPELTRDKFPLCSGHTLYRTGDRARQLPNGEYEFAGRIDHQLKIRGFRVEPGEVEAVLVGLSEVREAVVVGREARGGQRLVAYVVAEPNACLTSEGLRGALLESLPEYLVPSAFVVLQDLPRSSSGKVDREALPAPPHQRPELGASYIPPRTDAERRLSSIWSDVLDVAPVGVEDDFFELGADSLHAAGILARVQEQFGVEVSAADLFEARTIASWAARLASVLPTAPARLVPNRDASEQQLSFSQQGIWFLHTLNPESTAYHLPALLRVRSALNLEALGRAFVAVAERHAAIRTRFCVRQGACVAVVGPPPPAPILEWDLSALDRREGEMELERLRLAHFRRPFDLAHGPLFRASWVRLSAEEHVLLISMHHLVSDAWSMRIWFDELMANYAAELTGQPNHLPPLPVSYADVAAWQRARLSEPVLERELGFWRQELEGAATDLGLITDRPRPAEHSFRGAQAAFALDAQVYQNLLRLCRSEGATPFMALCAAYGLILCGAGSADEVVLGTPVVGRSRLEHERVMGHFANTIPIRVSPPAHGTFRSFLAEVRRRALAAYAHQELPFDRLVSELRPARDGSFQPLVQALLSLQPRPRASASVGEGSFELELLEGDGAPFDLSFTLWEDAVDGLTGVLLYSVDLFDAASVHGLLARFSRVLMRATSQPDVPVAELFRLAVSAPRARTQALADWLLEQPQVDDCQVRFRHDDRGCLELLAYVVGEAPEQLVAAAPEPFSLVRMSQLPRTASGSVDEVALRSVPVVDAELERRWSAALALGSAEPDVAVLRRERPVQSERVHRDRLLPSWALPWPASVPSLDPAPAPSPASGRGPLALADGGEFEVPAGSPRTLGEALQCLSHVASRGIHWFGRDGASELLSYASLVHRARALLGGLCQAGLAPGQRVILQLSAFDDYFEGLWACLLGGFVPVTLAPIQSTSGTAKLEAVARLLGDPVILADAEASANLASFATCPRLLCSPTLERDPTAARVHAARPDDVAFFQLTSGSTGVSKCIQETHRAVLRQVWAAAQVNGYSERDVTLNWLPFDHVVPILTCHMKDVVLGCSQLQVQTEQMLADPLLWARLVTSHRVTHTWCPNFGFKLIARALASSAEASWDLSSLKAFMNAGEQVTLAVVEQFVRIASRHGFVAAAVQPAYGMAELASVITYAPSPVPAAEANQRQPTASPAAGQHSSGFVDVGPPMPGVRLRVVDATGDVVPQGVAGQLQVQGGVVMPGYLDNPDENRRAFSEDGWFNTGDLGFLRDGRLTITGRAKETIIVRGVNVYCYEVEDIVNTVPGVLPTFAAASSLPDAEAGTEGLAVFFVAEPNRSHTELVKAIRRALTEHIGITPAWVIPLEQEELPKTSSGKLQRSRLKQALAEGAFEERLRELDLKLDNERSMSRNFHRLAWRPKRAPLSSSATGGLTLVFLDSSGLGERVVGELKNLGCRVASVSAGSGFCRHGADHYSVAPDCAADFLELQRAVGPATTLLHLAGFAGSDSGAVSLLQLARGFDTSAPAQLLVVASGAQSLGPQESVVVDKASVVALVHTLAEELPGLQARHLDLETHCPREGAQLVLRELATRERDREVAYRGGRRWVARLDPVDLEKEPSSPLPFVNGGSYWISGGLGGLGQVFARYLLRHFQARLLLLGRQPVVGEACHLEPALAALTSLAHECGGEVLYEALDVADRDALRKARGRVTERWGERVDGVLHLAGVMPQCLLSEETPAGLEAALHPKLRGAEALVELLDEQALFVAASSANAYLGGFGVGAYAAANRALHAFVEGLRGSGRSHSYCLAYSGWDEVGMSQGRNVRLAGRSKGFEALSEAEGLYCSLAALARHPSHLIAGLQTRHPRIQRYSTGPAQTRSELCVVSTSPRPALASKKVSDRFGTESQPTWLVVDRIQRDAAGLVVMDAAAGSAGAQGHEREYVAPENDVELVLVEIWCEVLGRQHVGIDDNFFDLGGHSLLLAQVRARVETAFGRNLPLVSLFRYPSIRALSAHLSEPQAASGASRATLLHDRGSRQRRALATQGRIRRPALGKGSARAGRNE